MDKALRTPLRTTVAQCRRVLEQGIAQQLEGEFGIHRSGTIEDTSRMGHLSSADQRYREELVMHLRHIQDTMLGGGPVSAEAIEQLTREAGFTHLNRLCAYKILEERKLRREIVGRGLKSSGFFFYLADHPEEQALHDGGEQALVYRHYLEWMAAELAAEVGALFSPTDSANRLFPKQAVLDEVLGLLNDAQLRPVWEDDEAIGWVYQYYTPKELRDKARKESAAPRNSYELAFRNQFYTPRYVVEFLVDNTLGRTWFEMRRGTTGLAQRCRYMVRRKDAVFLDAGQEPPASSDEGTEYVWYRARKDPRELAVLDPASGSGHFLLYCFDLLLDIYREAYDDDELGPALQLDFPDRQTFEHAIPGLILGHNLHGIDIDLRSTQIAGLALWLRAQRAYQELGLKRDQHPAITRANLAHAAPMPGERELLEEFIEGLRPPLLGQLIRVVFNKMSLAGEAGSLLRIEREIAEAIQQAKTQWKAATKEEQLLLFPEAHRPQTQQLSLFDITGITDDAFWDEVHDRVKEALREYAERASSESAFSRRLFSEDAAEGFGFIDLCQRTYDVVLMNPPFGQPSFPSRDYVEAAYRDTKNDVYAAFVERGIERLTSAGFLGTITSRTGFFLSSFERYRKRVILAECGLVAVADLGQGVLDTAMVETAAYCLTARRSGTGDREGRRVPFFRLLTEPSKDDALLSSVATLRSGSCSNGTFLATTQTFDAIPGAPFTYWVTDGVRQVFRRFPSTTDAGIRVCEGLNTTDNERFLRLSWEIDYGDLGPKQRWVPLAKGGEFSLYYSDLHLVLDWGNDGADLKRLVRDRYGSETKRIYGQEFYFKPGITYSQRTQKGLSFRCLPAGSIFNVKGPGIFGKQEALPYLLGLMNSSCYKQLVDIQTAFGSYNVGYLQKTPVPTTDQESMLEIGRLALRCHELARKTASRDETSQAFLPTYFADAGESVAAMATRLMVESEQWSSEIASLQTRIDARVSRLYGLDGDDMQSLRSDKYATPEIAPFQDQTESDEGDEAEDSEAGPSNLSMARGVLAYALGCVFGRWDIRMACESSLAPKLAGPFDPLSPCPPGMLLGPYGLPAGPGSIVSEAWLRSRPDALRLPAIDDEGQVVDASGELAGKALVADADYPLQLAWDGVIPDDADRDDNVMNRVRDVLLVLYGERAETVELEIRQLLGVDSLQEWFRNPHNFFEDHIKRYSKSARKAPIYWLLQSQKRSYGLWLYYQRLSADTLYRALQDHAEPKQRLEETRLAELKGQRAQPGLVGRALRQIEVAMERQEALISELDDFARKLKAVADFGLRPDLADGVVLNIAPLRELVPWKVAKDYWQELLAGKYEWSSIGKQLRAKGMV